MSLSSIDLCSHALSKIGADPIVSFDEGTAEAEICRSLYFVLKHKLLSSYEWSFAVCERKLNQVFDEENAKNLGYEFAYALPQDFLRALNIFGGGEYKIVGNYLYSNIDEVVLRYIANVTEEFFTPIFISAFIYLMSAELSISLLNDTAKYSLFFKLFNNEIHEAKSIDSQQDSPKKIKHFDLIDARK